MASSPVIFSGSSTYSSSFQQVIARAVGIASLPLQNLQNGVNHLNNQASAVAGLNGAFVALQADLQGLDGAVAGSPSAHSSDSTSVSATAATGALNGTYTIQVDDIGSSTTTLSAAGLPTVTDPTTGNISSATSFTLTVNGTATTITPSGTSLEDLVNAINSAAAGAQATIVNVGSNASPDYRLAVSSTSLGADTIQLNDGSPTDLLDTVATGHDALYKVNGSSTDVQSTSSQLTLSPGLTVNLLAQTSSPVTITVATSYSSLQTVLASFVTDYNSAVTALQQNVGQGGGALTGDSLVYTLTNVLNQVANYTGGSGGISSLSGLGISLEVTGQLSFNQSIFAAASQSDISKFLGSMESSSGFLSSAGDILNSVANPTTGIFSAESTSIQSQITNDNTQIANDQARVAALQANLQGQLSRADAAIATLQAQDNYYQQLFQAEYGNTGGINKANGG